MSSYRLRYSDNEIPLAGRASLVVGRDSACHLVIDDPAISRMHARVVVDADGVWIEDMGSQNGVQLNGALILRRTRMTPGDQLVIGKTLFALLEDGPDARPSAAPPSTPRPAAQNNRAITQVLEIQNEALLLESGRAALRAEDQPLRERFGRALQLVEELWEFGAKPHALALLGEALDELMCSDATGILSATAGAHVRSIVGRTPDDPVWRARMKALARAEQ